MGWEIRNTDDGGGCFVLYSGIQAGELDRKIILTGRTIQYLHSYGKNPFQISSADGILPSSL